MTVASDVLSHWNMLDPESAVASILPCCGSTRWAKKLVELRPIADEQELVERSGSIWQSLAPEDWYEAFQSHPRIGEKSRESSTAQSSAWSSGEQSGMMSSTSTVREALERGNRAYEQRFGRIYVVCATGKSAEEMLSDLQRRLKNDPETELLEAVEQQRQITRLRLGKWLQP